MRVRGSAPAVFGGVAVANRSEMALDHVQSMNDSRNRAEKNGGEKGRRHDLEIAGKIDDGDAGEGGKHGDEV